MGLTMTAARFARSVTTGLALMTLGVSLSAREMTLADAFARAPEANYTLLLQTEAVTASEARQSRSRADLLPSIDLSVTQARAQSPSIGGFANKIPGLPERTFDDRFDALLRASFSLFDANRWADFGVARFETRIARLQVEDAAQEVLAGIAEAYLGLQREQAQIAVREAAIARDKVLLDTAQQRLEAGAGTPLDATRAEVRLAGNELALVRQQAALTESRLTFQRLLNLPLGEDLTLVEVPLSEVSPAAASVGLVTQIMEARPDAQIAQMTLERNELARRATRYERLPDLELSGSWGYAAEAWGDDAQEQWSIQLGLTAPIFEGFRIAANQREAESAVRSQELVIDELRLTVETDYRVAVVNLESRWQEVAVARRQAALAAQELELEETRFREGVGDNNLVVDAQANLAEAEAAVVDAVFQYQRARLTLNRVQGDVRAFLR